MKNILFVYLLLMLLAGCKKDAVNNGDGPPYPPGTPNSETINFSIGLNDGADLREVFAVLNSHNFAIRQMDGLKFTTDIQPSDIPSLINTLNQKPYINTGVWRATPWTVFQSFRDNQIWITNSYHEMTTANQVDFLDMISTLGWVNETDSTSYMSLSIPEGSEKYWEERMKAYSFVRWTDAHNDVCLTIEPLSSAEINVPATGRVNVPVPIDITFWVSNGCGDLGGITEVRTGNGAMLQINVKYEGCFCTQAFEEIHTIYNYLPLTNGTHTILVPMEGGRMESFRIEVR